MKTTKAFFFNSISFIGAVVMSISSCDFNNGFENQNEAILSTIEVTEITSTTAIAGGNITHDGGASVTKRGVCWSKYQNPTIEDNKTEDGNGAGSYTSKISDLEYNTKYFVRAYATNSAGTGYGSAISFTTTLFGTAIVEVTNPITGRIWMDRNLGAGRAANSSTDSEGYGDLYQWGRGTDGHEKRDSPTTSNFSSSNSPGHGSFIQTHTERAYYDWRRPRNNNLWQGVNGENNPCPPGFRLPTEAELIAEFSSWSTKDAAGAFASPLKLPLSGNRSSSGGTLFNAGIFGVYWSSTVNGAEARLIAFNNSDVNVYTSYRAYGLSVRCLKD